MLPKHFVGIARRETRRSRDPGLSRLKRSRLRRSLTGQLTLPRRPQKAKVLRGCQRTSPTNPGLPGQPAWRPHASTLGKSSEI
mmetsp:Transcript_39581/g.81001  ORF Transcript_39581/g.81001 Transcript_39581/m.81001 type:complete len:83 (-) Transcript_39581:34-282(-)